MKQIRNFWRQGLVCLLLCALLTTLVTTLPTARAETTLPANQFSWCGFSRVCVNPRDGSLWVAYGDSPEPDPTGYNLVHFSKEGQPLKNLRIPANRHFLTIVFEPGNDRLYYEESSSLPEPVFTAFGYIDLQTEQPHKLFDTATIAGGCRSADTYPVEKWYYNASRKQFYLPCTSYYNATGRPEPPTRTVIVDTTTGKVVKLVDYQVLALHPDGGKLYAYREYYETISSGYDDKFFDVFLVDDQTLKATADIPLIQHEQQYTALTSFKVNSKTGLVYLTKRYCYAKCGQTQGAVIDRAGNLVVPFSIPKAQVYIAINEATNQVFGWDYHAYQGGRTEYDSFDGANVMGERLAQFYSEPVAIDSANNLIYTPAPGGTGFGLLVINGNTSSVVSFIKVQPPDEAYLEKARTSPPPPELNGLYFKETGHTLTGKFLDFWQKNGGLASLGYPITEPFEEYNPDLNRDLTVQYFERTRLELHPENAGTPYEVELGLLGHVFSAMTGPRVNDLFGSGETSPVEGGLLFKETGHTVTGKFLEYWQTHGGLTRHGLPLTQPTSEVNPIDGKTYLVQYFERSRLELHPEFAGTEYEVLLGLLGTQSLRAHAWPV
ncbi:MAG: hypothetical protein J0I20_08545 [Chloroflexi bacterium]|nr:hypothetical protein [Chloroflexota bacterium]OJV97090.1 MAG: hypothetical protein BGO39_18995 [Chloroflexi bacterium 54-19]